MKIRGRKADGLTTLQVGRIWKGAEVVVLAKMSVELYQRCETAAIAPAK